MWPETMLTLDGHAARFVGMNARMASLSQEKPRLWQDEAADKVLRESSSRHWALPGEVQVLKAKPSYPRWLEPRILPKVTDQKVTPRRFVKGAHEVLPPTASLACVGG